ncbi:MAG: hypothetical protein IJX16_05015 [Clostridia bacterium]|nr:hypothetical protein [Clostridia bacterium]
MILFRNRLIFGLIWKTVKVFFTVIYSILSFFNLHFTLLVGLIGVVLYFTGALDNNRAVLIIFCIILILTIVYAVIASIKKLLGLDKKVKRSKGVQIVPETEENRRAPDSADKIQQDFVEEQVATVQVETPKYFRVKQNPSYLMAEYSDRYELYKIENGALKKVRTDYKTQGENNGRIF